MRNRLAAALTAAAAFVGDPAFGESTTDRGEMVDGGVPDVPTELPPDAGEGGTGCGTDTDCADGLVCKAGTCRRTPGSPCKSDGECSSGVCMDSLCCDRWCGRPCESCRLIAPGTCTPVPAGPDPARCPAGWICSGGSECLRLGAEATDAQALDAASSDGIGGSGGELLPDRGCSCRQAGSRSDPGGVAIAAAALAACRRRIRFPRPRSASYAPAP